MGSGICQTVISRFFLCSLFSVLCSLSCSTTPSAPDTTLLETGYLPLEPGASAYLFIDVINARPLLDHFSFIPTSNSQVRQMIDRTHTAVAAVYSPGNERRYQVAAWGRYPVWGAEMALGANRNWKKQRSAIGRATYWYSSSERLSIALDSREILVSAATGDSPLDPFPPMPATDVPSGTKIPDDFGEFSRGAILSCWFNNPAPLINQKLREMSLPIELPAEQVFISIFPADEGHNNDGEQKYIANVKIGFPSVTQARGLVAMLNLSRAFFSPNPNSGSSYILAAILFSNPPVQDDRNLILKTNALSAGEISLLFDLFSL